MELIEAMMTAGTCRFYRTDPVPEAVLTRVLDATRFAPSGGNRQPVRWVVVRDEAKRRALANLYSPVWNAYLAAMAKRGGDPDPGMARMVSNARHFADHLHEVPVLIVVCASLADIYATDTKLGRLSIVGGASVYPAVQNLVLAARDQGLGTALTTLLCAVEPQVKQLLHIPDDIATAAMIALGWPAKSFPKKLRRRPLAETTFADEYGRSWGKGASEV
jgi:nitroreductase